MDEFETIVDSEFSVAIEDTSGPESSIDEDVGGIYDFVYSRYEKAKTRRYFDEQRWMRNYLNYRGIYGPDVQFTDKEKSRIFVKVTKTKVLAAYGQVIGVLFGSDKFPIKVTNTPVPEGVEESVHFDMQPTPQAQGEEAQLKPGETTADFRERLGSSKSKLESVKAELKQGPGSTQTQITIHPASITASKMEKQIQDQLVECNANKKLRSAVFECALLGTGILKGPFLTSKEYAQWTESGDYKPTIKDVPSLDHTSVWNFYPDPDADNMDEAEFVIERHKMSKSRLRDLKSRPHFRENAIDKAILFGENYTPEWWENQMEDSSVDNNPERFEVLEFWGFVDIETLDELDVKVPKEVRKKDQVSVNVWVCNNQVIRVVLNPYKPAYLPYHAVPYEVNPYSFFGIGVAENMDDTQTLMNGFMRMAVDNAALSGNMVFEVDEGNLVPGQTMDIYPGKIFRREAGAPGQALFGMKFPNTSNENMQLFDKARQLSDESTGLPSFAHGQTGVTGVGRTAGGISMLMSAANGSIRTVVKNIDDYLLAPLGKAFFRFNMQFNFNEEFAKGDLEVKASGTESLMANEVRSQRLMQFLGVVQNPVLAPFARMDYIITEIAKSMDLDPDKVVNNLADAAIQAKLLQQFQAQVGEQQQGQPGQEGAPAVPAADDTQGSGNGNIGVGQAAAPGEQGFSANVS